MGERGITFNYVAPHTRQITMPTPRHLISTGQILHAFLDTQPRVSKHLRQDLLLKEIGFFSNRIFTF